MKSIVCNRCAWALIFLSSAMLFGCGGNSAGPVFSDGRLYFRNGTDIPISVEYGEFNGEVTPGQEVELTPSTGLLQGGTEVSIRYSWQSKVLTVYFRTAIVTIDGNVTVEVYRAERDPEIKSIKWRRV